MDKKSKSKTNLCCSPDKVNERDYKMESIISIDAKGQIVLPKEIREKLNWIGGDKLALIVMEREGKPCCVSLIKTTEFIDPVNDFLGQAPKKSE